MLWIKRAQQSEMFRLFSGRRKFHQNPHVIFETVSQFFSLNFASFFSVMRDNYSILFLAETMYNFDKRVMQNLKKNQFVSQMKIIWWILIRALICLNNLHFDRSLSCKVCNVWPKKYKVVIFHDTEVSCKIRRKTDLWFGKWHEEFGKFSPEKL